MIVIRYGVSWPRPGTGHSLLNRMEEIVVLVCQSRITVGGAAVNPPTGSQDQTARIEFEDDRHIRSVAIISLVRVSLVTHGHVPGAGVAAGDPDGSLRFGPKRLCVFVE